LPSSLQLRGKPTGYLLTTREGERRNNLELITVPHQIIEVLNGVAKVVEAKEQGTLRYEIAKQVMGGSPPKIFVLEK
jgi:hypothetical protein